ncbi:MAG TPA: hypothetical protein VD994_18790 [Prosthecobacter sp.]|nr:hypothetical protein [Prosthecobacter sp.]
MTKRLPAWKTQRGYTAVELVTVLALGAMVLGGVVVGYGTLTRDQPRVSSFVSVPLGASVVQTFYGQSSSTRQACVAPHYGALAQAEKLREQFNTDIISATAVFCLPRDAVNTWKPATIPYNPITDRELDTPQRFRAHVVAAASVPASLYRDYRNPLNDAATVPSANASIFILGYSKEVNKLKVHALYDIDVIRFTSTTNAQGFHASVKRYAEDPRGTTFPLLFSSGYDVFYPPSVMNATSASQWSTDGFTPLFVTFERYTRRSIRESPDTINRFKAAAESPFYFIWWPDPAARHLGAQANTLTAVDPRQAYNHMAGRTSFMFTVPMFPAL